MGNGPPIFPELLNSVGLLGSATLIGLGVCDSYLSTRLAEMTPFLPVDQELILAQVVMVDG